MFSVTLDSRIALSTDILRQLRANKPAPTLSDVELAASNVSNSELFQYRTWLINGVSKFSLSQDLGNSKYKAQLVASLVFPDSFIFIDVKEQILKLEAIALGLSEIAHTLVEKLNLSTSNYNLPQISHTGVVSSYSEGRIPYSNPCQKFDCYAGLLSVSDNKCIVETGLGMFIGKPYIEGRHIFSLSRN